MLAIKCSLILFLLSVAIVTIAKPVAVPEIPECGVNPPESYSYPPFNPGNPVKLLQVIALIRHGDRTTNTGNKCWNNDNAVWKCELSETSMISLNRSSLATEKPTRLFRNAFQVDQEDFKGNCETGQLTSRGYQQHIATGKQHRQNYIENTAFLSPTLDPKEVYIRADNFQRTIQSAQALITGMFPPQNLDYTEIVDINTRDFNNDPMVAKGSICKLTTQYFFQAVTSKKYLAHIDLITQPITKNLTRYLNTEVTPQSMEHVDDCLTTHICHNYSVPVPLSLFYQSEDDLAWQYKYRYSYPTAEQNAQAGIGFLLEEMFSFTSLMLAGKPSKKFVLFSGHDTTIMPALTAFDAWDPPRWPGFASQITWEIYQMTVGATNEVIVRMIYNGQVMQLPFCNGKDYCLWNSEFQPKLLKLYPDRKACDDVSLFAAALNHVDLI